MKRIPDYRGELVMDDVLPLAGEDAADDEDARVRTKAARLNTLFNTGDSEPTGSGANHSRRTDSERVAVGVGFDDGQQLY